MGGENTLHLPGLTETASQGQTINQKIIAKITTANIYKQLVWVAIEVLYMYWLISPLHQSHQGGTVIITT